MILPWELHQIIHRSCWAVFTNRFGRFVMWMNDHVYTDHQWDTWIWSAVRGDFYIMGREF